MKEKHYIMGLSEQMISTARHEFHTKLFQFRRVLEKYTPSVHTYIHVERRRTDTTFCQQSFNGRALFPMDMPTPTAPMCDEKDPPALMNSVADAEHKAQHRTCVNRGLQGRVGLSRLRRGCDAEPFAVTVTCTLA